eukprot:1664647-Rhodomonas_salina.1
MGEATQCVRPVLVFWIRIARGPGCVSSDLWVQEAGLPGQVQTNTSDETLTHHHKWVAGPHSVTENVWLPCHGAIPPQQAPLQLLCPPVQPPRLYRPHMPLMPSVGVVLVEAKPDRWLRGRGVRRGRASLRVKQAGHSMCGKQGWTCLVFIDST